MTTDYEAARVERAAKAGWDFEREGTDWPEWEIVSPELDRLGAKGRHYYKNMARIMLTAAEATPDAGLQSEISTWVTETFRRPRMDDRWTKLNSEMRELKISMLARDNGYYLPTESDEYPDGGPLRDSERNAVAGEFADVMHLLFQMADQYDIDLIEATRRKFEVNKQRSWEKQTDGTYQHVEVENATD